jgi:integrase
MPNTRDLRTYADGTPIPGTARRKKPWRATYRDDKGARHSRCFATKAEADAWARRQQVEVDDGTHIDPYQAKQKFGPYGKAWLASRVVSETTRATDSSRFKRVLEEWGAVPLNMIAHSQVQAWVHRLESQGLAPATVRSTLQLLNSCLDSACRDRLIHANPCGGIRRPTPPPPRAEFLTPDEVDQAAAAMRRRRPPAGEFDTLVLETLVYTGLRWGELAGLEVRQLNMLRRVIDVDSTLIEVDGKFSRKPYPKGEVRRHVPIPRHIADRLAAHLAAHPATRDDLGELVFRPWVLPRGLGKGRALSRHHWSRTVFQPAMAEVFGCRPGRTRATWTHEDCHCRGITVHTLRHTYASWLTAAGHSTAAVQKLLGHKSIVTTQRYTHLAEDTVLRDAVGTLDRIYDRARG